MSSNLSNLLGYWKVTCFVDVNDLTSKVRWNQVPDSVKDKIRRGEVLRLLPTTAPHVLYGLYEKSNIGFWVVYRKKTKSITIRTKGELRLDGSYVLRLQTSDRITWVSARALDTEPANAIQWDRCSAVSSLKAAVAPENVPINFLPRERGRQKCACGDSRCTEALECDKTIRYVVIRRPSKQMSRDKNKRALDNARMQAQWRAFPKGSDQDVIYVYVHHMHPFAVSRWLAEQACNNSRFKTFTIPREDVEASVDSPP